jgi:hypothetical protein
MPPTPRLLASNCPYCGCPCNPNAKSCWSCASSLPLQVCIVKDCQQEQHYSPVWMCDQHSNTYFDKTTRGGVGSFLLALLEEKT